MKFWKLFEVYDQTRDCYVLPTSINKSDTQSIREVLECINRFFKDKKFLIDLNVSKNHFLFNYLGMMKMVKVTAKLQKINPFVDNTNINDLRNVVISYLSNLQASYYLRDSPDDKNTSWAYEFIIPDFLKTLYKV